MKLVQKLTLTSNDLKKSQEYFCKFVPKVCSRESSTVMNLNESGELKTQKVTHYFNLVECKELSILPFYQYNYPDIKPSNDLRALNNHQ